MSDAMIDVLEVRDRASSMMPAILPDLERLSALPSVAFLGYPPEAVVVMASKTLRLFPERAALGCSILLQELAVRAGAWARPPYIERVRQDIKLTQ
jgi:hypothetical protein